MCRIGDPAFQRPSGYCSLIDCKATLINPKFAIRNRTPRNAQHAPAMQKRIAQAALRVMNVYLNSAALEEKKASSSEGALHERSAPSAVHPAAYLASSALIARPIFSIR